MNNFKICKTCLHRKTDLSGNLTCGYNIEPESDYKCTEYAIDEMEKIRYDMQKVKANQTVSGGLRFANYIIDFIAYLVLSLLVGMFLGFILLVTGTDASWLDNMNMITQYFLAFIIMSSYYILFEGIFGQTLGKMITGTKVVTENGEKPSLDKIMTRTLCRFIPFEAFSFLGPGAIGWHDSLSKTRVVSK